MGNFKVQLSVKSNNLSTIYEVRERLRDFSIPLSDIIGEWAAGNRRKFQAAAGAELSGADEPPAEWSPVSLQYYRQKHGPIKRGARQLFADWLMVRTGALMSSLTTRGGFEEYFDTSQAVFGTPENYAEVAKATYNFKTRPTVFLGQSDRLMIKRTFQNYLNMGGNYRALLFAAAARRADLRKEMTILDAEFRAVTANG